MYFFLKMIVDLSPSSWFVILPLPKLAKHDMPKSSPPHPNFYLCLLWLAMLLTRGRAGDQSISCNNWVLRCVNLWVRNCVKTRPRPEGSRRRDSRNPLPINLHSSVQEQHYFLANRRSTFGVRIQIPEGKRREAMKQVCEMLLWLRYSRTFHFSMINSVSYFIAQPTRDDTRDSCEWSDMILRKSSLTSSPCFNTQNRGTPIIKRNPSNKRTHRTQKKRKSGVICGKTEPTIGYEFH